MTEMEKPGKGQRLRRWLRTEARSWVVMLVLLTVARTSFANHYQVPSGSMEDTLMPGDRVVVDMTAYGVRVPFTDVVVVPRAEPQRGEVVIFKSPRDGTRLIKRVVAVGGDEVMLRDGHLRINGKALAEPGTEDIERFPEHVAALNLDAGGGPDITSLRIPQDQVLVLGDHRGNSADGRFFGLVPSHALYARAVGVYYRRGEGLVWKRL